MAAVTQSKDGNKAMADEELPADEQNVPERKEQKPKEPLNYRGPAKPRSAQPGFFTIYKKGQGYWTRMGTAIGAGFLGLVTAFELYYQIPTFLHGEQKHDQHVALIVSLVFLAAYTLLAWWFTNKQTTVDFLVATDSEMKKVNWTTKQELIGSTKIVIGFMFFVAIFLFACDLLFGGFFHIVGVLKTWF
ncbi:MAG TPA: preprotein translocase subunit SecE [Tepidisphaeraceae bacterium]|nr:preprotein translocase subunit SecE [Tepidisphaeraceae bacterium]